MERPREGARKRPQSSGRYRVCVRVCVRVREANWLQTRLYKGVVGHSDWKSDATTTVVALFTRSFLAKDWAGLIIHP